MTLTEVIKLAMRYEPHPRVQEALAKYPALMNNPAIYNRLTAKYPGHLLSEKQFREKMAKIFYAGNSLQDLLKKTPKMYGGKQIPFPLRYR